MERTPTAREVVSNTSPILHFDQLGRLELLRDLYDRVIVPPAVLGEIEAGLRAGISVLRIGMLNWIDVREPDARSLSEIPNGLGSGERQVLAYGLHSARNLVILDDKAARRFAVERGMRMTGTLGVLLRGKREGLVEAVRPLLDRLQQQDFRLHPRTRADILALAGER